MRPPAPTTLTTTDCDHHGEGEVVIYSKLDKKELSITTYFLLHYQNEKLLTICTLQGGGGCCQKQQTAISLV